MSTTEPPSSAPLSFLVVLGDSVGLRPVAEQTVRLESGWNCISLEVQPDECRAHSLFSHQGVDSCIIPPRSSETLLQPSRLADDTLPTELKGYFPGPSQPVEANQPLFLHATVATEVTVRGRPTFAPLCWSPRTFNLVAFDVDRSTPPTFEQFFAGSPAHEDFRFYHLSNNAWTAVSRRDLIRRGTAYCVWCNSVSHFQGPIDLTTAFSSQQRSSSKLAIRNNACDAISLEMEVSGIRPLIISRSDGEETILRGGVTLDLLPQSRAEVTFRRILDVAPPSSLSSIHLRGAGMDLSLPLRANRPRPRTNLRDQLPSLTRRLA